MAKRINKITSLLVAAAAVISLVPANAATIEKIDSEDGTIYNAVAYKDGKAYIDGEIDDDEAAYYLSDGQFNELDDLDSGDDAVLFGEKYLNVDDGDYTVDLESGDVNDDDIAGDTADDAAGYLRREIKDDTDDRYDENEAKSIKDGNTSDSEDLTELNVIPGTKYAKPWYYTQYTAANKSQSDGDNGGSSVFNVYTDTKGNYIDADYNLGKIKVTTTNASAAGSKEVSVENTNDTYDSVTTDDAVKVSVSQDKVLAQDDNYIYRLVDVTATTTGTGAYASNISEINGKKLADIDSSNAHAKSIFTISGTTPADGTSYIVKYKAIQKISKQQDSDDVDGAKYAKTVTTYTLSDEDGEKLDADNLFDTNLDTTKFTIAGGKLIAYNTDINGNDEVTVRAYTLKSKSGYYYCDEEDDSKEDCENSDDQGAAVQTDVDGNLWRLDGGYIYKFDNTDDWDKVYKVDGSFDEFSVYDEDNIVAWSEDDEVYSLIGSQKKSDDTTTGSAVTTAGWVQAADGTWSYYKTDGTKAVGWLNDNGVWYYLNANGVRVTGWLNDNGTWYYLRTSGAMATGWLYDNGTWYFLNSSGAMATGWLNDNGTWYYLNSSGAMLSNTIINGYVLGSNGAWIK